jgi:hypothetical protein
MLIIGLIIGASAGVLLVSLLGNTGKEVCNNCDKPLSRHIIARAGGLYCCKYCAVTSSDTKVSEALKECEEINLDELL